jgi:hypothetical protein
MLWCDNMSQLLVNYGPTLPIGVPAQIRNGKTNRPPTPLFGSRIEGPPYTQVLDLYLLKIENGNMIEGYPLKK